MKMLRESDIWRSHNLSSQFHIAIHSQTLIWFIGVYPNMALQNTAYQY